MSFDCSTLDGFEVIGRVEGETGTKHLVAWNRIRNSEHRSRESKQGVVR